MAGMQFEYDEEGGTFFYFLLSFWALLLIPATYFLWPSKQKTATDDKKRKCQCIPCIQKREDIEREKATVKPTVIKVVLVIGWVVFALLAWKVSMIQLDYVEYDPFLELQIDRGASTAEIKKAYRQLSKVYHPDRETGDPKKFMRIAKAYAALTDEESRKNWEEYGNPDGPEATRFGIALPKWIVERENSMWVLAVYGLVFMIILPVVVGVWWYHSIKFSGDQVLLETTKIYYHFISKMSNMILKRAIFVLGLSCEFDHMHNAEIIERPTDNEELPLLLKQLPNVQEKARERPYCVKSRALLHAHFQRLELNPDTLGADQKYILKKCPYLINDMVHISASLVAIAMNSGRGIQPPRLESIENIMKMSQMVVQALDEKSSPLQQLPHITPDLLRHFTTRKRDIRHIRDFVSMDDEDRRSMLRSLTDNEYCDVMTVCAQMPYVEMTVKTEVLDEEDSAITAGSIVTVTVYLVRKDMGEMFDKQIVIPAIGEEVTENTEEAENEEHEENEDREVEDKQGDQAGQVDSKAKGWDKNKKGKKKAGKVKAKKAKQVYQWKAAAQAKAETVKAAPGKTNSESSDSPKAIKPPKSEKKEKSTEDKEEASDDGNNATEDEEEEKQESQPEEKSKPKKDDGDEEDDWDSYKMESKKENSLDTKLKESHLVHCPYFPGEKQEAWWVYVAERKRHLLITAPVHVCSLKKEEEIQLKFSAPQKPGHYQYSVHLRSDSYFVDFDQSHVIKLEVQEAKVVKDHPQWDISEDEDEKDKDNEEDESEDEDSDYSSEESE
ncbi:translocation protein SEC63 homolog [Physella acuta]|uniref:translocation protein SEC63 homolog n=1 Tax=Physella acuta TaxID=109671 RepID=UPI0027DD1246|nr:translocation protein SEC63 homolog [Physella acuta]